MKNMKSILSLFMAFTVAFLSIMPSLAESVDSIERVVISEELSRILDESEDDEKIKVYIWYKDIDQDKVDALTTNVTGLTPENCEVIKEFPSIELLSSLRQGDIKAESGMDAYLKRTESVRKIERERTETYSRKHIEISNEMYNQESQRILNALSIRESDVEFRSEFAPMIIAELTKSEIEKASKNPDIDEINLYHEIKYEDPSVYIDEGAEAKLSMGLKEVYRIYGLSGKNVDVGLVEGNIPGRVKMKDGSEEELEIDLDKITVVQHEDYPVTPAKDVLTSEHSHAYNTARVMAGCKTGVAKDINIYATNTVYYNVEELLKLGVTSNLQTEKTIDVLEVNVAGYIDAKNYINPRDPNSDWYIDYEYAYADSEKYYDHIISQHNIVTVIAGGNYGKYAEPTFEDDNPNTPQDETGWKIGGRVSSPGMAYNAITVGGYDNNGTGDTDDDDFLCDYSWKNECEVVDKNQEQVVFIGCEKPDVVMPKNFPGGGTSVASPALTAVIAMMLELKPSLSLHPEAVKAIVLASCHRKVNHTSNQGSQETMSQGFTERQGAGAPDAWIMASIVCQGTFGYGVFTGFSEKIGFVQPSYGANKLNISTTWIKENSVSSMEGSIWDQVPPTTAVGQAVDVNMYVYQNDTIINQSTLSCSSTEMCYMDELSDDFNYKIELTQDYPPTRVRYGYAWSTDNMYAPININQDSINYIRNVSNDKYITFDTGTCQKPTLQNVMSQTAFNDTHSWIVETNDGSYNISTGYGSSKLYLGQNNTVSGTLCTTQLSSGAQNINIQHNDDGTVSFLNSTNDKVLSYSGSDLLWNPYDEMLDTPTLKQKWCLEKVNYLCGDANMDGDLEVGGYEVDEDGGKIALPGLDQIFVQNYIAGRIISVNNLQLFLADINKDGVISIIDATLINQFADDKYL